ncbi:MAG TPA: helix-turn-helix domain-containing protein [Bryobacteraceae bacterium]|nr:helix-turn-helix domain-containing protein [Bryobacteraceae bacterium]
MSSQDATPVDYQLNWRKLQQVGLNAYEARSYLVLMGHPRFKALELAARAHVPRQKVYEVLDSLVEKGFAQVVQERTKLFSAVDPTLAIPGYLARRTKVWQNELTEQARLASGLIEDLRNAFMEGQDGRGTLDFLSLVNDPTQIAVHYRRMLTTVTHSYAEFSQPPFAVDPLDEQLVKDAAARGIKCRLLIEAAPMDQTHRSRLDEYREVGIEIRFSNSLPLKLALFDGKCGLVALLDPVLTRPSWTAVIFEHDGFAEAMAGLFESYWCRVQGND